MRIHEGSIRPRNVDFIRLPCMDEESRPGMQHQTPGNGVASEGRGRRRLTGRRQIDQQPMGWHGTTGHENEKPDKRGASRHSDGGRRRSRLRGTCHVHVYRVEVRASRLYLERDPTEREMPFFAVLVGICALVLGSWVGETGTTTFASIASHRRPRKMNVFLKCPLWLNMWSTHLLLRISCLRGKTQNQCL